MSTQINIASSCSVLVLLNVNTASSSQIFDTLFPPDVLRFNTRDKFVTNLKARITEAIPALIRLNCQGKFNNKESVLGQIIEILTLIQLKFRRTIFPHMRTGEMSLYENFLDDVVNETYTENGIKIAVKPFKRKDNNQLTISDNTEEWISDEQKKYLSATDYNLRLDSIISYYMKGEQFDRLITELRAMITTTQEEIIRKNSEKIIPMSQTEIPLTTSKGGAYYNKYVKYLNKNNKLELLLNN